MNRRPPPPWQYVVLAVVGSGFYLALFGLIPDDQPEARTALLGLLVLAGQAAVARWIVGHVADVKHRVNGRMSELIAALRRAQELGRDVDVSRETKPDVSRETKPKKNRGTSVKIISRAAWGARAAREGVKTVPISSRTEIVVHHSGGPPGQSVRAIQDWCMDDRGFLDIDYNFLVRGTTGEIYAGRGWAAVGSHTVGHNVQGIGICVIGREDLSDAAKSSLRWLYAEAVRSAGHTLDVYGHRDLAATDCPGTVIYQWLETGGIRDLSLTSPPMTGDDVRAVQVVVRTTVDGVYGPHTAAAVVVWQRAHDLVPDGIVGPKTRAAMGID